MIDVHVVLPSGRCSTVSADVGSAGWEGWEVADLMRAAEVALGNIQLQALVSSIGRAPWQNKATNCNILQLCLGCLWSWMSLGTLLTWASQLCHFTVHLRIHGMILGLQQSPLSDNSSFPPACAKLRCWNPGKDLGSWISSRGRLSPGHGIGCCRGAHQWFSWHCFVFLFLMGYCSLSSRHVTLTFISGDTFTQRDPTSQVSQGRGSW